jgi:PRTRC genetic system protein B
MKDITQYFSKQFLPFKGLIFYAQENNSDNIYVEAYDLSKQGKLINAHPLSLQEIKGLTESLNISQDLSDHFLKPESLLPANILYLSPGHEGFAIWYTPAMVRKMVFSSDLGLKDGNYPIPPMIWKADREELWVYAIAGTKKPGIKTRLSHAPFFNVHADGKVCMGTVDINVTTNTGFEEFMQLWQDYFFNSKFSHVIGNSSPMEGNIIQRWSELLGIKKFPVDCLKPHSKSLKNLLV